MARIVGCVGASGKIRDLAQSVTGRPTASSGATYGQLWISDDSTIYDSHVLDMEVIE
jgi:hypothetical protein